MAADGARVWSVWLLPAAYAAAFAAVRAYAVTFQPEMMGNPTGTHIGRVVAVNGFHVHHIYYGLALLPLAAALALNARRRRLGLLLGGIALALIVDEVGLVASGFTEYNHPWTWPLALATGLLLVTASALASRLAGRGAELAPPTGPRAP